ncbi:MAG TPA: hypothetical protein VE222_04300 [Nitrospiraceae bacterium]|nr:hypothetical protein [Nitrospiraceae bacterium]
MTRLWTVMICLSVVLTGCATERWVQDGKTANETDQAVHTCEQYQAPKLSPFAEPVYIMPGSHRLHACMESKGNTSVRQ